jgi:hypothetical protein
MITVRCQLIFKKIYITIEMSINKNDALNAAASALHAASTKTHVHTGVGQNTGRVHCHEQIGCAHNGVHPNNTQSFGMTPSHMVSHTGQLVVSH